MTDRAARDTLSHKPKSNRFVSFQQNLCKTQSHDSMTLQITIMQLYRREPKDWAHDYEESLTIGTSNPGHKSFEQSLGGQS